MSIKLVEEEVRRSLSNTEPEVLCISGKWGVGKTYGWNFYLESAKNRGKIGLQRYTYVSLFGLKSLNDLKYSLFESTKPVDRIGKEFEWSDLRSEGSLRVFEKPARKLISHVSKLKRFTNLLGATENILFSTVRRQLICIDDLERAGSGLDSLNSRIVCT